MQPKSKRRVHCAEFKAQVLSECRQSGASVAAISLKHGLNVNLVRKWLIGRGLKRSGQASPIMAAESAPAHSAADSAAKPALQFLPVDLTADSAVAAMPTAALACTATAPEPFIHIALSRGEMQLSVEWPASQVSACGHWLCDLLATSR